MGTLDLDKHDPFGEILARIAWAIRSTYHTSLQASPGQLVFGRDMLLDIKHNTDWDKLYKRQQNKIDKSNIRENLKRFKYDYVIGNKVLIKRDVNSDIIRKTEYVNEGPYRINQVYSDGTISIQSDNNNERLNIRRVVPYFERPNYN